MEKWISRSYGRDAVVWVFMSAALTLAVMGIAGTVFVAVAGVTVLLNITVPSILVGLIGTAITGMVLESGGYV